MKHILIIGNSGGIGAALEQEYLRNGWRCTGLSRQHQGLDLTRPETIVQALAGVDKPFDLSLIHI